MIVKGTKQLGNFKRGVNLYIPKRKTSAAPSGIPVSTQTIIVTNAGSFNATYTNVVPTIVWSNDGDLALELNPTWRLRNSETNAELNNASSDANYIPTTGWTQNGSPIAITLTAA
jgi:hypothetical protein